jgi:hypothetical protein
MVLLLAQSALTYSRGGLYNAVGAVVLAVLLLLRNSRARITLLAVAIPLFVVGHFLVFPWIDSLTNGTLFERFQDTSLTGRDMLIQADLQTWMKNLAWGAGPGRSALMYVALFRDSASHTEFSRMLAEHGMLGLASLVALVVMVLRNITGARSTVSKAVYASLVGWSFSFMLNVAMRMVAPSLLLGLTCAYFINEEEVKTAAMNLRPNASRGNLSAVGFAAERRDAQNAVENLRPFKRQPGRV